MNTRSIEWHRLIVLSALLWIPALTAAAVDAASGSISLEEARAQALARSTTLSQAANRLAMAANSEGIALSSFFPQLTAGVSLNTNAAELLEGTSEPKLSLVASQNLVSSGSRWFTLKGARLATRQEAASLAASRLSVLAELEENWFAVLNAEDKLAVAELKQESAQRALELAEKREAMGLSPRSTLLQARSKAASAHSEALEARFTLQNSQKALERLLGEAPPLLERDTASDTRICTFITDNEARIDELSRELLGIAADREPGMIAKKLALEEAGYRIGEDLLSWVPVQAAVSFSLANDVKTLAERTSISASASLPILPLNSRLKAHQNITLSRDNAALALGEYLASLEKQLWTALANIVSLEARRTSTAEALAWAEENQALSFERWSMGMDDWQTLSDAEQTLAAARNDELALRRERQSALSTLRALVGFENIEELADALVKQPEN